MVCAGEKNKKWGEGGLEAKIEGRSVRHEDLLKTTKQSFLCGIKFWDAQWVAERKTNRMFNSCDWLCQGTVSENMKASLRSKKEKIINLNNKQTKEEYGRRIKKGFLCSFKGE